MHHEAQRRIKRGGGQYRSSVVVSLQIFSYHLCHQDVGIIVLFYDRIRQILMSKHQVFISRLERGGHQLSSKEGGNTRRHSTTYAPERRVFAKKAMPKTMLTSIIDRDCASKFLAADRILSTPAAAAAISDVFSFFFDFQRGCCDEARCKRRRKSRFQTPGRQRETETQSSHKPSTEHPHEH
jgi:hypothetical protein